MNLLITREIQMKRAKSIAVSAVLSLTLGLFSAHAAEKSRYMATSWTNRLTAMPLVTEAT